MSYTLGTKQLELLNKALADANLSSASQGKYARAYELLFAMISDDGTGSAYISESDLTGVNLDTFYASWKSTGLDSVDISDWTKVNSGIDGGAWVFLRGVSTVNWGTINPHGEADYSKFIREYTKVQYETRFGTPATDSQVQAVSDRIALNILNEITNNNGGIPDINTIAENDASAAALLLFGNDEIAGWAGNPFLIPVGHTGSYNQNILVSSGDTYEVLSVIQSVLQTIDNLGISVGGSVTWNVFTQVIPDSSDPDNFASMLTSYWEAAGIVASTNQFLENAYGQNYDLLTSSLSKEIILGTVYSDLALNGTNGEDIDLLPKFSPDLSRVLHSL